MHHTSSSLSVFSSNVFLANSGVLLADDIQNHFTQATQTVAGLGYLAAMDIKSGASPSLHLKWAY